MALDDRLFIYPGPVLEERPAFLGHVERYQESEAQRLARVHRELEKTLVDITARLKPDRK